jgi:hypothetical protein
LLSVIKEKRGISVMVGYILLITLGIAMAILVYGYIRTFVPSDSLECPAGTSISLKEISCEGNNLNLTIKNNGRFTIHAANFLGALEGREVATRDFVQYVNKESLHLDLNISELIHFIGESEPGLKIGEERTYTFTLDNGSQYGLIEIIPLRKEKAGRTIELVVCTEGGIREEISC